MNNQYGLSYILISSHYSSSISDYLSFELNKTVPIEPYLDQSYLADLKNVIMTG